MTGMTRLSLVAVVAVASCGPSAPPLSKPPPGQTYVDYLHPGDRPIEKRPPDTVDANAMVIHVIDVGQGSATLVEFPCGAMLIDTGGESNDQFDSWQALSGYLDRFFDRRRDLERTLSLLVISHPHLDHTRNIGKLIARYRVDNVVDNGAISGDQGVEPQSYLHEWVMAHRNDVGHQDVNASDVPDDVGLTSEVIDPIHGCGSSAVDPKIRALWGGKESEEIGDNANNHSVVLRVDFGKSSLLLTGDVERLAIARLARKYEHKPLLDVDVFLVPHHGSRHSTALHLMRAVSPKVALISMGPYGRDLMWTARKYGHPHVDSIGHLIDPRLGVSRARPKPIEAWVGIRGGFKARPSQFERRTIRAAIYGTGWDGNIRVRANANGWIDVETDGR